MVDFRTTAFRCWIKSIASATNEKVRIAFGHDGPSKFTGTIKSLPTIEFLPCPISFIIVQNCVIVAAACKVYFVLLDLFYSEVLLGCVYRVLPPHSSFTMAVVYPNIWNPWQQYFRLRGVLHNWRDHHFPWWPWGTVSGGVGTSDKKHNTRKVSLGMCYIPELGCNYVSYCKYGSFAWQHSPKLRPKFSDLLSYWHRQNIQAQRQERTTPWFWWLFPQQRTRVKKAEKKPWWWLFIFKTLSVRCGNYCS